MKFFVHVDADIQIECPPNTPQDAILSAAKALAEASPDLVLAAKEAFFVIGQMIQQQGLPLHLSPVLVNLNKAIKKAGQ